MVDRRNQPDRAEVILRLSNIGFRANRTEWSPFIGINF